MKTKFAVVLSGGGFNGAFQVGALKYLSENWKKITGVITPMKFDIISGVSAGAINGAMLAQNELSKLLSLWTDKIAKNGASEIYTSDFLDTNSKDDKLHFRLDAGGLAKRLSLHIDLKLGLFEKLGLVFSKDKRRAILNEALVQLQQAVKANLNRFRSIADNTPLSKKLHEYLDRSKIVDTIFSCGFVSLNTGTYHCVKHEDFASNSDFINGVLASTAIPMIWEPVDKVAFYAGSTFIISHNNVDGGVMNVSPLGDVIKLISEDTDECRYKIFVINCNSGHAKYEPFSNKSIGAIAARSVYELSLTEVFNNDISHFLQINDLVKQAEASGKGLQLRGSNNRPIKAFDAVVICPERGVDLGSPLVANEKLITHRLGHGYDRAKILARG